MKTMRSHFAIDEPDGFEDPVKEDENLDNDEKD